MSVFRPPLMLQIGLNSWIIADGNYDDFRVGEVRSFALEYYNEDDLLPISKSRTACSFRRLNDSHYSVTGRTLHLDSEWAVIDVGVPAYRELRHSRPPPKLFEGTVWLGVDPFFYFERLARKPGAPALILDWRIHRIEVETAPRIHRDGMMIYDPERLHAKDVEDTREGDDFVLHCELISSEPRHSLGRDGSLFLMP